MMTPAHGHAEVMALLIQHGASGGTALMAFICTQTL
jgi:hypothetical protein